MLPALGAIGGDAAKAGPEVVRVRVPAKDVTRYFPSGTGLRILSPREFEATLDSARREPAAGGATGVPRLIRARHRARWDAGLLRGRTELVVGAGAAGPVEFPLDPWTPAILVQAGAAPAVGARDSGGAVLRIAASAREQALSIDWEQQPRPHSGGHGFSLGLPAVDTTRLDLELPRGWTASSQRGVRRGPLPTSDPTLSLWEIDGEAGRFDVELRDAPDRGKSGAGAGAWMSTTTEVDLRRTADLAGAMINWTADARLELDPRHAGTLEVELEPGLELIDVQGVAVQGYRTERSGDGTRVAITLAEGVRSTTLRFRAHASVPTDGAWPIPALRPLDAIWTGGRTTVILDELHAVRECRERAGRLVPSGRGDAGTANRLAFEAESPRSVADLVFVRPRPELACTVRGHLIVTGTPARLDCRLDWSLHRGSVSQLEVDLSPAWFPDQVRIQGLDDPLAWHSSPLPSGGTRLRVMLPASALASGRWALTIGATSNAPASRGPLELPRVRPVGAAVVDEAWLAWGDDGTTIHPVRARGLAWLEPAEVPGLVTLSPPTGLRQALAWRWTSDEAEARIDRERMDQHAWASIRAGARLAPDGRGLAIDGTLLVGSGGNALDVLPLWVDAPGDPLASWRFFGEDGTELRLRPLEGSARARLELSPGASARALVLDLAPHAQRTVTFRASTPWSSPGLVPLLYVPGDDFQQAIIRLETPAGMKSRVRAQGLGRLHPSSALSTKAGAAPESSDRPGGDPPRDEVVHAFSYNAPGARLELVAEPMAPTPMPGVVRDAFLTTSWDGRDRTLNRLRLLVQLGQSDALSLELPDGADLVRARHDGADVAPIRSGHRITMPATPAGSGARSSLIVLDYAMDAGHLGDGSVLRPDRPRLDLPCLSFTWEIATPAGWRVLDPGAGLVAADPDDSTGWPSGPLGLGRPDWPLSLAGSDPDPAGRLRQLDGRLGRPAPDELTFAEWFTRWDSGPWPVVIDRLALSAAGLGPKSSCSPGRLAADRRDSARALLQQHGLSVLPFADALLVTMESERPRFERQGPWLDPVAEAIAWGSDRTDRFQSVAHWRGEPAPRTSSTAEQSVGGSRPLPGRMTRRFLAPGWPEADAFVHLADARRRGLLGWIVAALVAIAWLSTSGRASGRRLVLPVLSAAACLLIDRVEPARLGALTAGGLVGSLAVLIVELARRTRRTPAPSPPAIRPESTLIRPAAGSATLLVLAAAIGSLSAAPAGPDAPIVALFPYEGTFDPARPPDRVILRLEDFQRLTRRAAGAGATATEATVIAVASGHRVSRKGAQDILVETEIELAARGAGPFVWRIPVSGSRDISATIGGEPTPIAVEAGGETATVVLPRAGNYLLSLRRWAVARGEDAGAEVLSLPVNATPAARLLVDPPGDGMPQGLPLTRGRIEPKPDGSLDGRLGPADRIVVRWSRTGRDAAAHPSGPVDGLLLWDVTPAGDRVRARLTYHRTDETASVRLSHGAGVILRSARATGGSRVYCEDDPASGHWILSFDPPLPAVATLSVDCWRPLAEAGAVPDAPGARPTLPIRRLPRIEPVGAERFTGLLGVRRPGDWTGRLAALRDNEPIDDEAFVKAWGTLPDEPLTLSGTSRLGRDLGAELRTGPSPSRTLIRPAVQLRIESGRIVVVADADVLEAYAPSPIMEAELPPGMQVTQVVGEGLIDWTVSPERRLILIWQRRESRSRRHVRVLGWIPTSADPLATGSLPHRLRTPWIGWPGAELGPGSLTVHSGAEAAIEGAAGLLLAPAPTTPDPSPAAVANASAPNGSAAWAGPRLSYVVGDPSRLGVLSWESRPPLVSVNVDSQLAIDPDAAEWVAVIRYEVLGGGLDRINLKVPAAWAGRATLHHSGEARRWSSPQVVGPSAFWTITPDRPLWGSHRFVLRASLPIATATELSFPELAPLGKQGAVDAYLRIMNATGRPLAAEDATGLRRILPIFQAPRFRDREFARDDATPSGIYRVEAPSWAWRIPLSRVGSAKSGDSDDAARVGSADVMLTVLPDRSVLGRSLYEVIPESGRLLTVELAPGSSILWAAVEPNPAVPLRAGPSSWSIALDPGQSERVCLIWKAPPPAAAPAQGGWSLPLPRAGREPVRTLLSWNSPAGVSIGAIPAGFQPVTIARLDTARAEWLDRSIRELIAKLDRSSGRDHERLVSLLINHELALRAAERAGRRDEADSEGPARDREPVGSVAGARAGIDEAIRTAGLNDDLAAARSYLGLSQDAGNRPPAGIPEPIVPCRIRAFGRPSAMIGTVEGLDGPSAPPILTFAGSARDAARDDEGGRSLILAAAIAVAAIVATSLDGRRAPASAAFSLALTLAASALAGGPLMLAGGLGLATVARLRRGPWSVAGDQ
jgi:hypothetical protein